MIRIIMTVYHALRTTQESYYYWVKVPRESVKFLIHYFVIEWLIGLIIMYMYLIMYIYLTLRTTQAYLSLLLNYSLASKSFSFIEG